MNQTFERQRPHCHSFPPFNVASSRLREQTLHLLQQLPNYLTIFGSQDACLLTFALPVRLDQGPAFPEISTNILQQLKLQIPSECAT